MDFVVLGKGFFQILGFSKQIFFVGSLFVKVARMSRGYRGGVVFEFLDIEVVCLFIQVVRTVFVQVVLGAVGRCLQGAFVLYLYFIGLFDKVFDGFRLVVDNYLGI